MRAALLACAALSGLAFTACAPTGEPGSSGSAMAATGPERQCFDVNQVENFRQGEIGEVYFRVRRNQVFKVDSAAGCQDLDFANRLAILPDVGGSVGSRICTGDWARLVVPGASSPAASMCRVRVDRVLSADEVAALPSRSRP